MKQAVTTLTKSLEGLSDQIVKTWGEERRFCDVLGAQFSPITKRDVAKSLDDIIEKLKTANTDNIDPDLKDKINEFSRSADHVKAHFVPHFYNGNNLTYLPRYYEFIEGLKASLSQIISNPIIDWNQVDDQNQLPHSLRKKLRNYYATINNIEQQVVSIESKISTINAAHEAAEALPADLQDLKNARDALSKSAAATEVSKATIDRNENTAHKLLEEMTLLKQQAESIVGRCEEAYRITTTKGLAAAFEEKAKNLAWSMWIWVVGLIISLAGGAYFGSSRVELLSSTIEKYPDNTTLAVMQIIVAVFSVGAPLWFAWIATKQIGQRFRLAEDYAFKASVSKAYEGYRKEASRLDTKFESRLFDSALQRLDEAPLRLVESESHGSPWHELINSKSFHKALDKIPNLNEKLVDFLKKKKKPSDNENEGGV